MKDGGAVAESLISIVMISEVLGEDAQVSRRIQMM